MERFAQSSKTALEFRDYLKSAKRDPVPDFDEFLHAVGVFFRLRSAAEDRFSRTPHLAKNKRGALPLSWEKVKEVLLKDDIPEEDLISQIAKECLSAAEDVLGNLRKVLSRTRQKVGLGNVQQVDSHCLLWLTRQPGRNAIEKAGCQQKVLAVVRRENFDTLENRVLKNFLLRSLPLANQYLERNEKRFPEHAIVKNVKRFMQVCRAGLLSLELSSIADLKSLPKPNYVLLQDRRYSKIWGAYLRLVERANVAERLWDRRREVAEALQRIRSYPSCGETKYYSELWLEFLDGKKDLLDQPCWDNVLLASCACGVPAGKHEGTLIVDLTGTRPCGGLDLLVYLRHRNAKPLLENFGKKINPKEVRERCALQEILENKDQEKLKEFFEQFSARVGGESKEWIILIPDDWSATWQEQIIRAAPLPRANVCLLWRSVAAIRGLDGISFREGEIVAVADFQKNGKLLVSKLEMTRRENSLFIIPQRKSYARIAQHYYYAAFDGLGDCAALAKFLVGVQKLIVVGNSDVRIKKNSSGKISVAGINLDLCCHFEQKGESFCERGAKRFEDDYRHKKVPYYDELEDVSLVVQTKSETVEVRRLVKGNAKFPGGKEYLGEPIRDQFEIQANSRDVKFYLHMGEFSNDAPLKFGRVEVPIAPTETEPLTLQAKMTPGQGLAIVTASSPFFSRALHCKGIPFDLQKLEDAKEKGKPVTKNYMEAHMERSFPPSLPYVEADSFLWSACRSNVLSYLNGRVAADGGWFAKANLMYSNGVLPPGASPLDILKRKNVFGNGDGKEYPQDGAFSDFFCLFKKLADDYQRLKTSQHAADVIRLIAWTYQADNPDFRHAKDDAMCAIERLSVGNCVCPSPQVFTLCANLCNTPQEWQRCLCAINKILSRPNAKGTRHALRLLYNLLQFNPKILILDGINDKKAFLDELCKNLIELYKDNRNNIGFVLKCLLFLLRRRVYDGKTFLTKNKDFENYNTVKSALKSSVGLSQGNNKLRETVLKYLDGKGTIDGLLLAADE